MKKISLLPVFIILSVINLFAQENSIYVNGYTKTIYGEAIEEDCSCTLAAITAITARSVNDSDYIEWETSAVSANANSGNISFVWSGGYATGTKDDENTFTLLVNDKPAVSFITASRVEGGDWQALDKTAKLSFKNIKSYNRAGNKKDYWGYFVLTIPANELTPGKPIRIKVKGDATGSRYWFRTMEYALVPKIRFKNEYIIDKDEKGKLTQRVKMEVEHYDFPRPVTISSKGAASVSGNVELGQTNFYLNFDVVKFPAEKTISVKMGDKKEEYKITLLPVKKKIFYLLAHSHVDIGYTELQDEVEKKQWKNIEEGISLAKQSAGYKNGSAFKWNVEVLWAVKSYLEKFPEKKKTFYEAVRKGWIGLDATYDNLLTGLSRPEELYRWLEYSNKLEKEIGVKIQGAMISDVPGYTWGTVQAFADNGIKYFSVGPNETDRLGGTLKVWGDKPFYWESPSGKNKILIWVAGKGYSWFHKWDLTKGDVSPLMDYLDSLEAQKYPYDMVQLRYTVGDNKGPNKALPGFIAKWNKEHVTPQFKLTTTKEMFSDFEKKYAAVIPTQKGDFSPYWEDGAASSAKETAMNRNTAELLTQLEVFYTLNRKTNYPSKVFEEAWRNVLLYSEHTWGAYNSVTEPELQSVKDQWKIKQSFALKADSIAHKLLEDIQYANNSGNTAENINVWNLNSWKRSDAVVIPSSLKKKGERLVDDKGNDVVTQKLNNGDIVFIAEDILPFSAKHYRFVEPDSNKTNRNDLRIEKNRYPNNGIPYELDSYVDKNADYGFNCLIYTGKNAANPRTNHDIGVISEEHGPVVNSVVYESKAPGCKNLQSEIKTYSGLNKTEIINTIDKENVYERENVRFAFPFNIPNPETKIDIAWSVIRPETDQLPAANKNYFTAQRWIDVSNDRKGVTLASLDAPFFEIGDMNAEKWDVPQSSVWEEHASSSAKIFSWVMNNSWNTNYKAGQDGLITFRYVLRTHDQFDYSSAYRFGVEQSQPLLVTYSGNKTAQVLTLDEDTKIVVTSVRPAIDGKSVMVRLYNPTKESSKTKIKCADKNVKVFISNGDEEEKRRSNLNITMRPFEVVTLKIK